MPGDLSVRTRVMRRSEQQIAADRLETSEFMQQVFDSGDPGERPLVCQTNAGSSGNYMSLLVGSAACLHMEGRPPRTKFVLGWLDDGFGS
jgi:hypothetical protein